MASGRAGTEFAGDPGDVVGDPDQFHELTYPMTLAARRDYC